jgi:hypothetical protein
MPSRQRIDRTMALLLINFFNVFVGLHLDRDDSTRRRSRKVRIARRIIKAAGTK